LLGSRAFDHGEEVVEDVLDFLRQHELFILTVSEVELCYASDQLQEFNLRDAHVCLCRLLVELVDDGHLAEGEGLSDHTTSEGKRGVELEHLKALMDRDCLGVEGLSVLALIHHAIVPVERTDGLLIHREDSLHGIVIELVFSEVGEVLLYVEVEGLQVLFDEHVESSLDRHLVEFVFFFKLVIVHKFASSAVHIAR